MGKAKRTLGVILAALMLVVTCMTYVPASAAVVLPTVKFVGLQNIPAAVGEDQTLFLTSNFDGNVQYQVFYVQRNDPSKAATTTWTKLGDWTTAADAKTPVEVKVPKGTITVAGNYSFAIRVKRAGVTGQNSNTYGDFDSAYAFNYAFAATATEGLKAATLASAEVTVGEDFIINGLTAGNSYKLYTLNETRANRWESVATSTTNAIKFTTTAAGSYVLDLQLLDAAGKVTAVKLFNVKVNDAFKVTSAKAINATQVLVTFNKAVDETSATTPATYTIGGAHPKALAAGGMVLADDAKSVVLTMAAPISGTNLYVVDGILLAADTTVEAPIFTAVETYSDTVAPAVSKVEYPTYDTVKVSFSEPMQNLGTITITQDGALCGIAQKTAFAAGDSSVTYDLTNAASTDPITFVMVGAVDQNNNILSPSPNTLTFTKVKSDTTAPTVVDVKALSDVRVQITFSEKLKAAPVLVTVGGNAVTFAADATSDNITWVGDIALSTTGIQSVVIPKDYSDMSGNLGAAYSKLIQLTADTTAPVLASSEVKAIGGTAYLVLHYNEAVTPQAAKTISGTIVVNYISNTFPTATVTPVTYESVTKTVDTKTVLVDISSITTFPVGAYTVKLQAGMVKDLSSAKLDSAETAITFTKGSALVTDSGAPTVNAVPAFAADNSTMLVKFSEPMDPATALNVANYKVGGASIFSSAIFVTDATQVQLTVTPGTIAYTGLYNITVSGAKDAAGNVMTAYAKPITVEENVKPYVAKAVLTANDTITVTFNEKVNTAAGAFEVYINGAAVTVKTCASVTNSNTVTVVLTTALTDFSKTIQVKLVDTNVTDSVGNISVPNGLTTVTM